MEEEKRFRDNRLFILNGPVQNIYMPLAVEIGEHESMLLLQLDYWLSISNHVFKGEKWTYQSISDIQKTFLCWSRMTIQRVIVTLNKKNLIKIGNFNKKNYDRTRWFTLNFEGIKKLETITIKQVKGGAIPKWYSLYQNGTTIPLDYSIRKEQQEQPACYSIKKEEKSPAKNESLRKELKELNFNNLEIERVLEAHTPAQIKNKLQALENRRDIRVPKIYFLKMLKADYPNKNTPVISDNGGNGDSSDDLYPKWKPKKDIYTPEKRKLVNKKIAEMARIALEELRGPPNRLQVASS
jgi:hypothetical protein